MAQMPQTKFSKKRMSPALASYMKRTTSPTQASKIKALLRPK